MPSDTKQEISSSVDCDQKELVNKSKILIEPYQYDNSKLTQVEFKKDPQKITVEIPLFFGEEYRVVFTTVNLPQNSEINIYDKPAKSRKRELLYGTTSNSGTEFLFELERADKMVIEYDIPPVGKDSIAQKACILFMMGYR